MKKTILGSNMLLGGLIGIALIFAGAMTINITVNEVHSAFKNISLYGLMPVMYIFIGVGFIGLILALWGLFDKKD